MENIKAYMWDKIMPINNVDADSILKRRHDLANDEVIIVEINGRINNLHCLRDIKSSYNLDLNISNEQVCELYLGILKQQQEETKNERLSLEEATNKISTLEAENKQLKEVTKEQDDLLVDNAYKITMLEMNLGGK